MATTLNAGNATSGAAISADTTGILQLQSGSTPTTAVTVDTSQNVGIGITSPAYKLDAVVTGNSINSIIASRNTTSGTAAGSQILVGNDSSNDLLVLRALSSTYTSSGVNTANGSLIRAGGAGGMTLASTDGSGIINFATGGTTERMRIGSDGNIGIGATSDGAAIYIEKAQDSMLNLNSTSGYNPLIQFKRAGTRYGYIQPTVNDFRIAAENTSNGLVITAGGSGGVKLTNTATSWVSNSDITLKNVTGTYTTALADIAQIEAIKFTWKSDTTNRPQVGVSAQSVQKVIPEAVEADNENILGVRYTEIIPLLVASIQELNAKVDAQALEIQALKGTA